MTRLSPPSPRASLLRRHHPNQRREAERSSRQRARSRLQTISATRAWRGRARLSCWPTRSRRSEYLELAWVAQVTATPISLSSCVAHGCVCVCVCVCMYVCVCVFMGVSCALSDSSLNILFEAGLAVICNVGGAVMQMPETSHRNGKMHSLIQTEARLAMEDL
jgi:hypothetical protein